MEDLVGGALLVSPHLVRGGVLGTPVLQQEGDAAQILDLASRHYINTPSLGSEAHACAMSASEDGVRESPSSRTRVRGIFMVFRSPN